MPIYEYRCQACGEEFDKLIRSLSQIPQEMICPKCQSKEVQRVVSAPAVHTGGRSGESGEMPESAAPSDKPPVFGRKELKAAQEKKARLRDQALSGD
jgi:putative FmdB family regulatory protein